MKKLIKPVAGKLVRCPKTMQEIPESGMQVTWGPFWQRRLKDGEIELVEKPTPAKKAPRKKKKSEKGDE